MFPLISKNKHTISNIIRYRTMNIQYKRKIIDIEFVESISRGLNRYWIMNIDIEAITSISKLQLWVPRAHWISFDIELCMFDIKEKSSISNLLNRYWISISDCQYRIVLTDINISQYISSLLQGVRSQGKLQRIQDRSRLFEINMWMWRGAMEGPFLAKSPWIKLWNCEKRGCRNPGHVALRLFVAGVMQPEQRELPLRSEWHWVNAISYTISSPIYYDMTFDIESQ